MKSSIVGLIGIMAFAINANALTYQLSNDRNQNETCAQERKGANGQIVAGNGGSTGVVFENGNKGCLSGVSSENNFFINIPAGSIGTNEFSAITIKPEEFYPMFFKNHPQLLEFSKQFWDNTSLDNAFQGYYKSGYQTIDYCAPQYYNTMNEADKKRCDEAKKKEYKPGVCPEGDMTFDQNRNICVAKGNLTYKNMFCPTYKDPKTGLDSAACAEVVYKCPESVYMDGQCFYPVGHLIGTLNLDYRFAASMDKVDFGDIETTLQCNINIFDDKVVENLTHQEVVGECGIDSNGFTYCRKNLKLCTPTTETMPKITLADAAKPNPYQKPQNTAYDSLNSEFTRLPVKCSGNTPIVGSDKKCYPTCVLENSSTFYGSHPQIQNGVARCMPKCGTGQVLSTSGQCLSQCNSYKTVCDTDPITGQAIIDPITNQPQNCRRVLDYSGYSVNNMCKKKEDTPIANQSLMNKIKAPNDYVKANMAGGAGHCRANMNTKAWTWYDQKDGYCFSNIIPASNPTCPNGKTPLDMHEILRLVHPESVNYTISQKLDLLLPLTKVANVRAVVRAPKYYDDNELYGIINHTFYGCFDLSSGECDAGDKLDPKLGICKGKDSVYKATFSTANIKIDRFPEVIKSKCYTNANDVKPGYGINPPMVITHSGSCGINYTPQDNAGITFPGYKGANDGKIHNNEEYYTYDNFFYGRIRTSPIKESNSGYFCPNTGANIYGNKWYEKNGVCVRDLFSCDSQPNRICSLVEGARMCSPNPCFDKKDISQTDWTNNNIQTKPNNKPNGGNGNGGGNGGNNGGGGKPINPNGNGTSTDGGSGNGDGDDIDGSGDPDGGGEGELAQCKSFYIFNGSQEKCRKKDSLAGFVGGGCCSKDKYMLGIMSCKNSEKDLQEKRLKGKCHEIGDYCSKKLSITNSCIQTSTTFCCFGSKLARIIHEQGRPQINLQWGTPQSPQCRGFTPGEFQKLDFSEMNLSEFINDLAGELSANEIKSTTQKISKQLSSSFNKLADKPQSEMKQKYSDFKNNSDAEQTMKDSGWMQVKQKDHNNE